MISINLRAKVSLAILTTFIAINGHSWTDNNTAANNSIYHVGVPLLNNSSNEFVAAFKTDKKMNNLQELKKALDSQMIPANTNAKFILSKKNSNGGYANLVLFRMSDVDSIYESFDKLADSEETIWTYPNFEVTGDPREMIPNDPGFTKQHFHKVMQNHLAWDIQTGSKDVIVAVTDDGIQIEHEDLMENIWTNPNEIPDNGLDDDNNGFIDDVHGWDFTNSDNNTTDLYLTHGTHVSGIVAGAINNNIGIVGTAPSVTIMPIKFYGGRRSFNAAIVAESYAYAVNNGAKIITTSFNIDEFKGNPIYIAAIELAYQKGLLIFNSAGNNSYQNPRRISFHEILLIASTETLPGKVDQKSNFSNYGSGIDLAAPGSKIYSSVVNNDYDTKSGTSMASPNAAAVAALIWSHHPEWSRDQVAAQLIGTAKNLDELNPKYKGLLGAGRVDSFWAITTQPRSPSLNLKKVTSGRTVKKLTIDLNGIFNGESLTDKKNWKLTKDNREITIEQISPYKIGTNRIALKFNEALAAGTYKLEASNRIKDPFGNSFNNDGGFVTTFAVSR